MSSESKPNTNPDFTKTLNTCYTKLLALEQELLEKKSLQKLEAGVIRKLIKGFLVQNQSNLTLILNQTENLKTVFYRVLILDQLRLLLAKILFEEDSDTSTSLQKKQKESILGKLLNQIESIILSQENIEILEFSF